MVGPGIAEALVGMESGTHAILIYDSQENKRDVLFNHLRYGINKEGLVYACSEEKPQEIRDELRATGMDVVRLEAKGTLAVKYYDEVYFVGGEVDAPRIVNGFSTLAREYERKGMNGIRAVGEMDCFFKHRKIEELIQYEYALHTRFPFPAKGICAYNLVGMENSGNLESLWPIIKAHGLVIMTGPHGSFALPQEKLDEERIRGMIANQLNQ
jgi:hypothetical protein